LKYRVLVVEDHEWWRRCLCDELEHTSQWEVAAAVADGVQAVHKARDLRPDIILLDVGLPGMDGLQAAQQILAHDPAARILFVTEQQSLDIAEAALSIGGRGFIAKSDVGRDLLPAMDAVINGERFVSTKMVGRGLEACGGSAATGMSRRHEAAFYTDESSLMEGYARFIEHALNAGDGLLMLLTSSRRDRLRDVLRGRVIDLDRLITERRCVWVDVAAALSACTIDGRLDDGRFWNAASSLVMEAARGSTLTPPRVSACGECAPTLLREGRVEAAIHFEQLCDRLAMTFEVGIFCPYFDHGLRCDDENAVFRDLRTAHSSVHVR